MLPVTAGSIIETAQALLNDVAGQIYTTDSMLPLLRLANNDLSLQFEDNDIPITSVTSAALQIEAGMTDVGGSTGPALPADLVEIYNIYERTAGTANDYMRMGRRQFLPLSELLTPYLQVWSFQNQVIQLLGANSDVEIKIEYLAANMGSIVNENSQIRAFNVASFLQYRLAGHCAMYIGENPERARILYGEAAEKLDLILNISIKKGQSMPVRRRPFRSRYKQNGVYPS